MDPKTTPPMQDDKLTGPNGAAGAPQARQVSVDIQGAPDSPVVDNGPQMPSTAPDFSDSMKLDPLPGAGTAGPAVPPVTDTPANPMADEGMGGTPGPVPGPGAPVAPAGPAMPPAGMPPMPGAAPAAGPGQPAAAPQLFAHDAGAPPMHAPASQGRRMMIAAGGLLLIMIVAVVVAYVMSR